MNTGIRDSFVIGCYKMGGCVTRFKIWKRLRKWTPTPDVHNTRLLLPYVFFGIFKKIEDQREPTTEAFRNIPPPKSLTVKTPINFKVQSHMFDKVLRRAETQTDLPCLFISMRDQSPKQILAYSQASAKFLVKHNTAFMLVRYLACPDSQAYETTCMPVEAVTLEYCQDLVKDHNGVLALVGYKAHRPPKYPLDTRTPIFTL